MELKIYNTTEALGKIIMELPDEPEQRRETLSILSKLMQEGEGEREPRFCERYVDLIPYVVPVPDEVLEFFGIDDGYYYHFLDD